jgi:hypothetical protein
METIEITIKVPKDFADDAQDFDLLNPEMIVQILRAELDDCIMKFVDAEVKAHRAEQRDKTE